MFITTFITISIIVIRIINNTTSGITSIPADDCLSRVVSG